MDDNSIEVKGVSESVIVGALCGFVAAVSGATLEKIATVGVMIGGVVVITLSVSYYAAIIKDAAGGDRYSNLVMKLFIHVLFALASFLIVGATAFGVNWVLYRLPGKYLNWLSLAALPVGYLACRFKQRNLLRYGMVEVLVGFATALGATARASTFQPTQGLTLIGATYIVARGFNNVADARKKAAT